MTIDFLQQQVEKYFNEKEYYPEMIIMDPEDFDWYRKEVNFLGEKLMLDIGGSVVGPTFNGIPVQTKLRLKKFQYLSILDLSKK